MLIASLAGIHEGVSLVRYGDPNTLSDVLGPGFYILSLSVALLATSLCLLVAASRRSSPIPAGGGDPQTTSMRMYATAAVLVLYALLLTVAGYLLATLVFFFLEFRLVGIRPWFRALLLTVVFAGAFYFVFVQQCNLVFPRGLLIR